MSASLTERTKSVQHQNTANKQKFANDFRLMANLPLIVREKDLFIWKDTIQVF